MRKFLLLWLGFSALSGNLLAGGDSLHPYSLEEYAGLLGNLRTEMDSIAAKDSGFTYRDFAPLWRVKASAWVWYESEPGDTVRYAVSHLWIQNYMGHPPGSRAGDKTEAEHPFFKQDTAARLRALVTALDTEIREVAILGGFTVEDSAAALARNLAASGKFDIGEDYAKPKEKQDPPDFEALRNMSQMTEKIMSWTVFGLLGALLIFVIIKARKVVSLEKNTEEEILATEGGLLETGDPLESDAMRAAAQEALKRGDLHRALRGFYLAFILRLHETGTIRYNSSLTTWEYYRLLRKKQFPDQPAYNFTLIFDQTHYGRIFLSRERFEEFRVFLAQCDANLENTGNDKTNKETGGKS